MIVSNSMRKFSIYLLLIILSSVAVSSQNKESQISESLKAFEKLVNQPIEEAINLSSVTLRKSGIKIEKILANDLPLCQVDPLLIEEVILNLVTNATEAMKNMDVVKIIKVSSSMGKNSILILFSDSGPGVNSGLKDKMFDPFYTTKNGSTGIGLSINHRIITDHGGSLRVSTSKLGGAEFVIKIPVKKD